MNVIVDSDTDGEAVFLLELIDTILNAKRSAPHAPDERRRALPGCG